MKAKDFMDPYLPLTFLALSFTTMAMILAPERNWFFGSLIILSHFLSMYGLHTWDVMKGGYRNISPKFLRIWGGILLMLGVLVAIYVSLMVQPLLLGLVGLGMFLGVAYNLEYFDGVIHDDMVGPITCGISVTFVPVWGMSIAMGDYSISAMLFAVAWTLFLMALIWIYEGSKPVMHQFIPLIDNPGEGLNKYDTKLACARTLFSWIATFWILTLSFILRFIYGL